MDADTDHADAGGAGIGDRPAGRELVPQGLPAPVSLRRRWGWLVIGLIVIGGILCGWAVNISFYYVCTGWFGVDPRNWYPWWGIAEITCAHIVVIGGVLAASYYWFRRRPSDTDPGA